MKHSLLPSLLVIPMAVLFILSAPEAAAFERYHHPNSNDNGYCASCHPGFGQGLGDDLHALHTGGSDPVTGNCGLCHTGSSWDNPFVMWSSLDTGEGRGCTGCHGRDYDETIAANYGGFPLAGKPKSSGYGLIKHHLTKGVVTCIHCHADPSPSLIKPEWVNPPYYERDDVALGGMPLNACDHEDTANDHDDVGLDNDGDLMYDGEDPDCSLTVDTHLLRAGTGGLVDFTLRSGSDKAHRNYFILGSASGIEPGLPLPGGMVNLPLNWDVLTDQVISLANSTVLPDFNSVLDAHGEGAAQLNSLGPLPPAAVGARLYFAYLLYYPVVFYPYDFVSNPTEIRIVP